MSSSKTPNFKLNLPAYAEPNWHTDVNSNFSKIDTILKAGVRRTLEWNLPGVPTVGPAETRYLLGMLTAVATGVTFPPATPRVIAASYGQGRVLLTVATGADLVGDLAVSGTRRLVGTGSSSPGSETIAINGAGQYVTQKYWRHTGVDNPLTLEASTVSLAADADFQLVDIYTNENRRFTLNRVSLTAEAVATASLSIEIEKVTVAGQAYSSVELVQGRLDLTEAALEAGVYHDSLVLNELVDSCSGEGLLMRVVLSGPLGEWSSIRVTAEISEEPVLVP